MAGLQITLPVREKARIEIIPLIDVIFFLLATFVLFTLSLNRIEAVPVNLPVPAPPSNVKPDEREMVTIQVSGDQSLYWNRELIEAADLPARIAFFKTKARDPRVLIVADEKARFGSTVSVLDEVRKAGIEKFSVETRTRPSGK
jgi:biopolymer transport protein ExbD